MTSAKSPTAKPKGAARANASGDVAGGHLTKPTRTNDIRAAFLDFFAKNDHAEIRLSDLQKLPLVEIDVLALRAAGLVPGIAKTVKVIKTGKIEKAVTLTGILVTAGAKAAIEAAGGSVADVPAGKVESERKTEPKTELKSK